MAGRHEAGTAAATIMGSLAHLNVCSTTTIITPASEAIGMKLSSG